MPLYSAKKPPSVLYIVTMVTHIPGNFFCDASLSAAKDADCMDNRVRTISNGYVKVTDVIPAAPPHTSRLNGDRSAPGEGSTNYMVEIQISHWVGDK